MSDQAGGAGRGQVKVGLVGIGRGGLGMHVPELAQLPRLFKIVAACDLLKDRRETMAEAYGCATYRNFEEMLKDDNVELVDIATPSRSRGGSHLPARASQTVVTRAPGRASFSTCVQSGQAAISSSAPTLSIICCNCCLDFSNASSIPSRSTGAPQQYIRTPVPR